MNRRFALICVAVALVFTVIFMAWVAEGRKRQDQIECAHHRACQHGPE